MRLRNALTAVAFIYGIFATAMWVRGVDRPFVAGPIECVSGTTESGADSRGDKDSVSPAADRRHSPMSHCPEQEDRPLDPNSAGGLRQLREVLERQGLDATYIERLVLAAIEYQAATLLNVGSAAEHPYWQTPANVAGNELARTSQRLAQLQYMRDSLLSVYGDELVRDGRFSELFRPFDDTLPFLSSSKQIRLMEIREEAAARTAELGAQGSIAERVQMIEMIDQDMEKSIEQLLEPEEYKEYLLRDSSLSKALVRSMTGFEYSEQEFRDIFNIHDEVKPAKTAGYRIHYTPSERERIESLIRGYLGPTRYESYSKYSDPVFHKIATIAEYYGRSMRDTDAVYSTLKRMHLDTKHAPQSGRLDQLRELYFEELTPLVGAQMTQSLVLNTFPIYDSPDL